MLLTWPHYVSQSQLFRKLLSAWQGGQSLNALLLKSHDHETVWDCFNICSTCNTTHYYTYLIANRACEDSKLRVPVLTSGSVISISAIINSISSLLTLPRYLFGLDNSLVGNLNKANGQKGLWCWSLYHLSSACPESDTPRYGNTFCMEKFDWLKFLSNDNPCEGTRAWSSFLPLLAARFLATPLKSLRNLPDLSIAAMLPRPCDNSDWRNLTKPVQFRNWLGLPSTEARVEL